MATAQATSTSGMALRRSVEENDEAHNACSSDVPLSPEHAHMLRIESAIGDERHDKTIPLNGAAKLKFKATRLGFKIGEALGKACVYYTNAPKDLAARKKFG